MNLLLDTHIFLWSLLEPGRLSSQTAKALESPENRLWLSPITTWETLVLAQKGRIILDPDPFNWLKNVFNKIPFSEAPLTHEVATASRKTGLAHPDPADNFLAATAKVYGLVLVTADKRLTACTCCEVFSG